MKILLSGSSGLVGSALVRQFSSAGGSPHEILRLVRQGGTLEPGEIAWDPPAGRLDPAGLEGVEAVVHLAGESIASGRWTTSKKERIYRSRVEGTRLLCRTLAPLHRPPRVLVSASAIGYYGDRGDEVLDEDSPAGSGFLAEVCRDWEAATEPAAEAGIRVVRMRLGIVLSAHGGPLARMLPLFRLGLGGPLGSGRQYVSWITLDDLVAAIRFVLDTDSLSGPVNMTAPEPVTNRVFTRALAGAVHRPAVFAAPAFVLRLVMGEMADALLLSSARVDPKRLLAAGFRFAQPTIAEALRHVLSRR